MTFFSQMGIGVCLRRCDRLVCYQNDASREICGDRLATPCQDCIATTGLSALVHGDAGRGTHYFPRRMVKGRKYDIFAVNGDEGVAVMICPFAMADRAGVESMLQAPLSARESEVLALMLRDVPRPEMAKHLHVSHVYAKLTPIAKKLLRLRRRQ